nr:uncharacterized protein LOC129153052 [Nothobranchius furzeri]
MKPDALSQQYASDKEVESTAVLPPSCIVGAITWDITAKVLEAQQTDPDPGTGPPNRTYVPCSVRSSLIKWAHASKFSIHPGVGRTLALIRRTFWWPALYKDVKEYISACQVCARSKANNQPPHSLLCPLPVPSRPWSHIALDFVTGLPISKGFNSIFTVVDRFSKSCHLVPLQHLPTSAETANLLIKHVFRLHGIPSEILSDRGRQFISRVWKEFATHLGARVALSSGFHPQTNGKCERMNQELEVMLRCVCSSNPSGWSDQLAWIEYHVPSATGQSPFKSYQPPLFPSDPDCSAHLDPDPGSPSAYRRLVDRRRRTAPAYAPGQQVWLSTCDINPRDSNRKFSPQFSPLHHRRSPQSGVCPSVPASVHESASRVPRVPDKPVVSSPLCPPNYPPPPVRLSDGGLGYRVRRILDICPRGRGRHFLVDWEGYGPEHRQWILSSWIDDVFLIRDFEATSSVARPPGGVPGVGVGGWVCWRVAAAADSISRARGFKERCCHTSAPVDTLSLVPVLDPCPCSLLPKVCRHLQRRSASLAVRSPPPTCPGLSATTKSKFTLSRLDQRPSFTLVSFLNKHFVFFLTLISVCDSFMSAKKLPPTPTE